MNDVIEQLRAADERTRPPRAFDFDTVLRRGRWRVRRRRALQSVGGVAAAVLTVGAIMMWPDEREGLGVADPSSPQELLGVLAEPQQPADRLPSELMNPPTEVEVNGGQEEVTRFDDLVEGTSRKLGEAGEDHFWVAVNEEEQICLIGYRDRDLWSGSLSCASPAQFVLRGECLGIGAPGNQVEARILPDGYELGPEESDEWTHVSPNLSVRDGDLGGPFCEMDRNGVG